MTTAKASHSRFREAKDVKGDFGKSVANVGFRRAPGIKLTQACQERVLLIREYKERGRTNAGDAALYLVWLQTADETVGRDKIKLTHVVRKFVRDEISADGRRLGREISSDACDFCRG
jgi:hypothetical protein